MGGGGVTGMTLGDADARIKLIDLGCATWEGGPAGSLVQTVQYRAPEVCLGLEWSFPCDMWSVGCVILELLDGGRLFNVSGLAASVPQHLAMMQRLTGQQAEHLKSALCRVLSMVNARAH
jgi:serine/threonine protein kinase